MRSGANAAPLKAIGCTTVIGDVQDVDGFATALRGAEAVQLILPVRPYTLDPARDMLKSIDSIAAALGMVRPNRLLIISDYGAHVANDIGMPSIFRELEARVGIVAGHTQLLRSAEHMHNWGRVIRAALATGALPTFQDPADKPQPIISAQDLGLISANMLLAPCGSGARSIVHAEASRRYSAEDVAATLGQLAGRAMSTHVLPRHQWRENFSKSPRSLADLLIRANDAKNLGGLVDVDPSVGTVVYGQTELIDALRPLVERLGSEAPARSGHPPEA
jgi:uncharacterized protein YbjT (DUF2867 family)